MRGKPSHPQPDKKRGGGQGSRVSTKKSFGPQFGLKIRRGPMPPGPLSLDLPLIIIIVIIILIINNNDDDLKEAYLLVISISTRSAILYSMPNLNGLSQLPFSGLGLESLNFIMLLHFNCSKLQPSMEGKLRTLLWMCYIALLVVVIVVDCTSSFLCAIL